MKKTLNFMPKKKRDVEFYYRNWYTKNFEVEVNDWNSSIKSAFDIIQAYVDECNSKDENDKTGIYNFTMVSIEQPYITSTKRIVTVTFFRISKFGFKDTDKNILELAKETERVIVEHLMKKEDNQTIDDNVIDGYDFNC